MHPLLAMGVDASYNGYNLSQNAITRPIVGNSMHTSNQQTEKRQGVFKLEDGTFIVLTFTKSYPYKTEKGANKKWEALVLADLV